jgi:lysozyme
VTTPLKVDLVDISHHNDITINWVKAAAAGVQGVVHKATEGSSVVDDKHDARRAAAAKAHFPFGAYGFASPDGPEDGVREAKWFLDHAKPKPGDLIPWNDFEDEGACHSIADKRTYARGWNATVKKAIGVNGALYCPWDLGLPYIKVVPRYNNSNTPPVIPADIWQFSNGVFGVPNSIPGFGHVDLDTFRRVKLSDLLIPDLSQPLLSTLVMTQNLGNKPEATAKDLDAYWALGCAAYGFQEGRDRVKALNTWVAKHPDAALVPLTGLGADDVPILYRKSRLTLRKSYTIPVAGPTDVGDGKAHSGAGPDTINPKCIAVAEFYDQETNRLLWVFNCHQIASWTRTAKYLGTEEWRDRRAYGSHLIELLVKGVDANPRGNIFVTGDFNADQDFTLMSPLQNIVDLGNTGPTHGPSRFDYVGVDEHPSLDHVNRTVVDVGTSDHKGVVADAVVRTRAA